MSKFQVSRSGHMGILAAVLAAVVVLSADRGMAANGSDQVEPFFELQELYEGQRFPSVVVALDGTVLAFRAQNRPVEVRRSEDGGATWGPIIQVGDTVGNLGAAIVDETRGDVLIFQSGGSLYRSRDTGRTWQRQEFTLEPDGFGGLGNTHGADSGITLQHGEHPGRLLMPARVFPPGTDNSLPWRPYIYNSAIYSDDGGRTWQTSVPFPVLGTGEAALAELSDGRIYYNSRSHMATDAMRRIGWSVDGGASWNNPEKCRYLPDGPRGTNYGCMGGLARLPLPEHDILLYSNLDEPTATRRRITVWASQDGARTWPVKRLVYDGPSAYSSLAAGRPGTPSEGLLYLLFEGGPGGMYSGLQLARFNLAWVLAGEPTGDGKVPERQ